MPVYVTYLDLSTSSRPVQGTYLVLLNRKRRFGQRSRDGEPQLRGPKGFRLKQPEAGWAEVEKPDNYNLRKELRIQKTCSSQRINLQQARFRFAELGALGYDLAQIEKQRGRRLSGVKRLSE